MSLSYRTSWSGGYTAPTTWNAPPKPTPAAPATIPAPPAPAAPSRVDPFFRPEDLMTQNNFWAQWNGTFADLDHQLADLQTNTAFDRAQLAAGHTANVSGINDNAAARGIGQSSIRDGSQAQEQTNFTRNDQHLQDGLNSYATYVQGQKDNFNTVTKPGFLTAQDAQAVQNAQDVPDVLPPAGQQSAPAPASRAPTTPAPRVLSQQQQVTTHQAVHHATRMVHHALGVIRATNKIQGGLLR